MKSHHHHSPGGYPVPSKRIMSKCTAIFALAALVLQLSGAEVTFDSTNNFGGFNDPFRLEYRIINGLLELNIKGRDSRIVCDDVDIEPAGLDFLEIRYKATGLPERTGGQLYFATPENPDFAPARLWHIPSLISDGLFHTFVVPAPGSWKNASKITKLRLDMVDHGIGGKIQIHSIRFRGKDTPAMTADIPVAVPADSSSITFDANNNFGNFNRSKNCSIKIENNLLRADITGKDSHILCNSLNIDPKKFTVIEIRYKATGLPAQTGGQIFFATPEHPDFAPARLRLIPSLISDGNFHTLRMTMPASWKNANLITKLRLDMLDQGPGGTIWIEYIRFTNTSAPVAAPAPAAAARNIPAQPQHRSAITFDTKNNFGNFNIAEKCTMAIRNDLLEIDIQQKDSRIISRNISLDSKKLTCIEICYKAENLPARTGGQIYFTTPDDLHFSGRKMIHVPSLIPDGQFHTIRLNAPPSWGNAAQIVDFRLDIVEEGVGGKIFIKYIRFRPSASEPLAQWPAVTPELPAAQTFLPPIPQEYFTAKFISAPGDTEQNAASGRPFFIRFSFQAPADIRRALVQISVDDKFRLFCNGQLVCDKMFKNSWKLPTAVDIAHLLRPGQQNVIAVEYQNEGGPGGVLMELSMLDSKGSLTKVRGNETARCSSTLAENWTQADFDDSAWAAPVVHGTPPERPWTKVLPYQSISGDVMITFNQPVMPEKVKAGETLTLDLTTDHADISFNGKIVITSPYGKIVLEKICEFQVKDGKMRISVDMPEYFSSMPMLLSIIPVSGNISFTGGVPRFNYEQKNLPGHSPEVRIVRNHEGQPAISVDGVVRNYIFRNNLLNHDSLSMVPADFYVVNVYLTSQEFEWQMSDGQYDFTPFERVISRALSTYEKPLIIIAVGLEPPVWWGEAHRDQMTLYSDGTPCFFATLSPSFASRQWLEHSQRALTALIRHFEKAPYANRIGGYLLTNGKTFEWQYWGGHESGKFNKLIDYSKPMKDLFRSRFGIELPTFEERMRSSRPVFYDPQTEMAKIRANQLLSQALSEFMCQSAETIRRNLTVPKLIGTYYGYHLEYPGYLYTKQLCGHNDLRQVLDRKCFDFIFSPPSYGIRQLGEASVDMKAFRSISNAGVLSIVDDDTRTHLIPYSYFSQCMTRQQTIDIMRRNMGMALCRGQTICLLPIHYGNAYNDEQLIRELQIIRAAADEALRERRTTQAEIAVIVDENSYDYMLFDKVTYPNFPRREYRPDGTVSSFNAGTLRLTGNLISYQVARLSRMGAPADYLLASDVAANADKYKLWIFLNAFVIDDEFAAAVQQIRNNGGNIIWFYAPGIIRNNVYDIANIGRLTGIQVAEISGGGSPELIFNNDIVGYAEDLPLLLRINDPAAEILATYLQDGSPAAARRRNGRSSEIMWCSNYMRSRDFRSFAKDAGVHIYSDSDDVLFAGNGFITFHASFAGNKKITLPGPSRVTDILTGEVLAENAAEFTFTARLHETRIFKITPQ